MFSLSKTLAALLLCSAASLAQAAETAICYNCPSEWADWGTQLKAIADSTGVQVPLDNKNSGQALAQIVAEQAAPVADVVYYGVTFGLQAQKAGVVDTYKPKHWDDIPAGLKDPQGHWFAIHSGTLGIMVNVDALGGLPVPQSWADLLKPEYKGMVGYLDPSSAFVGYVSAVAINQAMGGTLDNFGPAIDYFQKLAKNSPIVPKQTAYARVLSGELPILVDYDFNAYRARYKDKANVAFVIPKEGTIGVPYVMSMVAKRRTAPMPRRCWISCCLTRGRRCGPRLICVRCARRCLPTWPHSSCRTVTTPVPVWWITSAWPLYRKPSPHVICER